MREIAAIAWIIALGVAVYAKTVAPVVTVDIAPDVGAICGVALTPPPELGLKHAPMSNCIHLTPSSPAIPHPGPGNF